MTRRCSHCSNNGHNSRTCPSRGGGGGGGVAVSVGGVGSGGGGGTGVKLFGVRLTDGSIIKKSASMGNLSHCHSLSTSAAVSPNPSSSSPSAADPIHDRVSDGYVSDDPARAACSSNRRSDRKKGVPWTEEEHRKFLIGLQKLGKGDWRGIARNYVLSRTPTQVASHAQKHFIRQTNARRRRRRTSLFDMVQDMEASDPPPVLEEVPAPICETEETISHDPTPSDVAPTVEFDSMDTTQETVVEAREVPVQSSQLSTMVPAFFPLYVPLPLWPPNTHQDEEGKGKVESHKVLKPIPVLPKEPVNVDELVNMSQLSLRETGSGHAEPSPLSLNLLGAPSRPSAFHANITVGRSEVS